MRFANVVVAAIGLVVMLPVMVLIAILIKLTSPGPVFFLQTRVGMDRRSRNGFQGNWRRRNDLGGRLFTMYKFRTMYVQRGSSVEVWARPGDPRITPIGAFLRRYRLDELPQLVNVLKGDMNVVGPRPEQPTIFVRLREQIDGYPMRQRVLPGITGWGQVNHHYDNSVDDVRRKLHYDLEYLQRRSVGEDLKIMLLTLPVMVGKKGAV